MTAKLLIYRKKERLNDTQNQFSFANSPPNKLKTMSPLNQLAALL